MFFKAETGLLLSVFAILVYVPPSQLAKQCSETTISPEELQKFNYRLFSEILKTYDKNNIILSPFSIQTCLAITRMGASGRTSSEIDKALTTRDQNRFSLATHYSNIIKRYANSTSFTLATKLYINNVEIKQEFNNLLSQQFLSGAEPIDFSNATNAASIINSWVDNTTNHKVKDLVRSNSFDSRTQMVLVNAIHLKGEWLYPFDEKYTEEMDFHADGKTFKVQMMQNLFNYGHAYMRDFKFEVLELPYRNTDLSMWIVLPLGNTSLSDVEQRLQTLSLADIKKNIHEDFDVEVSLPKFTVEFEVELSSALQNLGIRHMFSAGAEFDQMMAGKSDVHVSSIVHKAVIEINERGTEAAGAIEESFADRSVPPKFKCDRPFHYMIKNDDTVFFEGNFRGEP